MAPRKHVSLLASPVVVFVCSRMISGLTILVCKESEGGIELVSAFCVNTWLNLFTCFTDERPH